MFNFCVHEKNTQQIWQLEQGNSIAWHDVRWVFPVVFWEGAKQMCSNIYKCTIFTRSSAAHPDDFTRSRLQSGVLWENNAFRVLQNSRISSSKAPAVSTPLPSFRNRGKAVKSGQSSYKTSASRIHYGRQSGQAKAGAIWESAAQQLHALGISTAQHQLC